MHRQTLQLLLERYARRHTDEQDCIERFRAFVETQPDCFQRSLSSGHITGAAWLVNRAGTHVLLTHHRKLNAWLQLGGHADGDHDIVNVALREAQEESGIDELYLLSPEIFDLDIHPIPARGAEPAHFHYDVRFAVRTVASDRFTVSAESKALEWVNIERIAEKTNEPTILRMADKWLTEFAGRDSASVFRRLKSY